MLPIIPRPAITRRQKSAALLVAGAIDLLQILVFPTFFVGYAIDDFLDFVAAFLLVAICGFKWQFVLAFFLELVPALDLLPTWTAVVATLPVSSDQPETFINTSNPPPTQYPPINVSAVVVPPKQNSDAHSTQPEARHVP